MKGLEIDTIELGAHHIAGRRAALAAFHGDPQVREWIGPGPDEYDGRHAINCNGLDIGPAIDAAVTEAVIRVGNPDDAPRARLRWWRRLKFWR